MGLTASAYQRMQMALLPQGKVWRLIGASFLAKLFLGCADEIGRLDARAGNLVDESDPRTATELLPEYERALGLDVASSTAERRARIQARLVARQRYRPVDFREALAPLLGQAPADVVVLERTHAFAASSGDVREIYRFFVYRNPAVAGVYYLASAQKLVDEIKPSHTVGHVIESVNFLCNDPYSLCDRDLLGA